MIKKSFIIACIAAAAFSMTVQQTEELTDEQEARRAERRAARQAARQAEREANGGSCTKNRLNDAIDNATTDGETATAQTGAQKQLKLIQTRAKAQVKDEMLEVEPGQEEIITPPNEDEVYDKEKAEKEEKELKEKKQKKEKPAKAPKDPKPTTLNTEEGEGELEADSASSASDESEDSSEETEDYDSEDESVDSESSDSSASEEETTVIPADQTLTPQIKGDILAQLSSSGHDC